MNCCTEFIKERRYITKTFQQEMDLIRRTLPYGTSIRRQFFVKHRSKSWKFIDVCCDKFFGCVQFHITGDFI